MERKFFKAELLLCPTCCHPYEHRATYKPLYAVREEHTDVLTDRPDLQLKLVQIFFRHGARTPIRLTPGVEEVVWDKDTMFIEEDYLKCDYDVYSLDGKSGPHHSVIEESYQQATTYKGGAHRGQLTTLGMNQTYELGTYFRKHYIEKLKFLSPKFNYSDMYLRSTNVKRNLKSMSCVLAAMYGEDLKTNQNGLPRVHVDHESTEILYPNYVHCKPLMDSYFSTTKNTDVVPGIRPIRLQVQELLDQDPDKIHLDLVSVRDGISARQAHDFPLSPVLEPIAGIVEKAAVDIMKHCIAGADQSRDNLPYSVGPLLSLIVDNVHRAITGESPYKFHLHSCHDTTLMPLLMAVGSFDDTWPGLCSDFIVEMYQDRDGRPYVRNLYLGKELRLGPKGTSILTLEEFKELLRPCFITQEDFRKTLINVGTY
ncbi:lysophosphatidic acid phosphatase type 6-like [Acanthaster planci]|uniref:Lysophosphatidic acid phosphatase type 6-like n=1 Tax=Acanthaster planci TaxID=133434 RepID=A0A8B7XP73_ACAPL|nr:lysophosphatidic acid phosphatase type 6-like [Acanthaster planci]